MSYCRFENTLQDLRDCFDHMDESIEEYSTYEKAARPELIKLCIQIAEEYSEEVEG